MSLFDETERRPLSVSELTSQVRGALENRFASVWVEGEISNFKQAASGHWYFTVRDEGAQLRSTCFRGVNARIRFRPSDGLLVRVRGRMTVYEPRGEYELIVEALDPVGAGALRVAFEQLKERLAAEGLFDESVKRELPLLPRRVGVVTSPTGAAIRDIIRTVERRTRTVSILLAPTRVQGEGAGAEVARAIRALNEHHLRARRGRSDARSSVDVIIVGRGGGSAEDLWAFNEEEVARAIRASLVPVISAVGHETDFTIADFAADVRAATPTAAAEIVAEREDEIGDYVERLTHGLFNSARYRVLAERARVQEAAMSPGFDEVRMRLRVAREEFDDARCRLENRAGDLSRAARRRLEAVEGQVLARGRGRVRFAHARASGGGRRGVGDGGARAARRRARGVWVWPSRRSTRCRRWPCSGAATRWRRTRAAVCCARRAASRRARRVRVRLAEGSLRCRVEEVEATEGHRRTRGLEGGLMSQGRRSRIVIDVDRVRAEAQAKKGRGVVGRAGRVLGVTGLIVVGVLLVLLVGSYMWYQGFKKSPPYSLALLLDAAQHDDVQAVETLDRRRPDRAGVRPAGHRQPRGRGLAAPAAGARVADGDAARAAPARARDDARRDRARDEGYRAERFVEPALLRQGARRAPDGDRRSSAATPRPSTSRRASAPSNSRCAATASAGSSSRSKTRSSPPTSPRASPRASPPRRRAPPAAPQGDQTERRGSVKKADAQLSQTRDAEKRTSEERGRRRASRRSSRRWSASCGSWSAATCRWSRASTCSSRA